MADTSIRCPNCGTEIPLTEALSGQLREQIETALRREHETRLARARARASGAQELALLRERLAEEQAKARVAQEAELTLRKEKARLEERSRELDLEVARSTSKRRSRPGSPPM